LFDGVQIRRIRREENEFATWQNVECGIGVTSKYIVHTSLIFDKGTHVFRVMNIAVVQNEDASRTRVRVGKGNL
jgi:hypothetical protein